VVVSSVGLLLVGLLLVGLLLQRNHTQFYTLFHLQNLSDYQ
jgi:hypothetical protein